LERFTKPFPKFGEVGDGDDRALLEKVAMEVLEIGP
jgi:hypothetical protein